MQIQFPDQASRTYKDILEEMISSIPKYSEKWTNHNPSDPGITVLEILAWIFDANFYRIGVIPEESYLNFLRLIAGARGEEIDQLLQKLRNDPNSDRYHLELLEFLKEMEMKENEGTKKRKVTEMKAAAISFINSRYRAVTEDDFKALAIEATHNNKNGGAVVNRVEISGSPDGKVDLIIISDRLDKYEELKKTVREYIEPRRLICTKINVKEPVYTPVDISIEVACLAHARPDMTADKIKRNIQEFLDPLTGGDDKKGWVYGRTLTVFELYHKIEETEGVDHAIGVVMDHDPSLKIKKIMGLVHPVNIKVECAGTK